jgi:flavin reductase (DIM6/NTAB) family NADH-FMN oxidoreductase RutF
MSTEPIEPQLFRSVMGHFPTGVTAVTALDAGEPVGMTVGSFTSVSLDPPLVAFLPGRHSRTWARIRHAGSFCVNVLTCEQLELCSALATNHDDKFGAITWHTAISGSPVIDGALAWIDCAIDAVHPAGDHDIVVGRVLALQADVAALSGPLLFFRGGYGRFSP